MTNIGALLAPIQLEPALIRMAPYMNYLYLVEPADPYSLSIKDMKKIM